MSSANRTKKFIITAAMTTALAVVGLQVATAGPGAMKGPSSQHPCTGQQLDKETIKARNTFLSETTELRKSMAEKRAAMRALMNNNSPDPEKASKLAGELFDLREKLRTQAQAAGLPAHMMMGMGRMGGGPSMGCSGPGMGGRHHGGNAM